MDESTRIQYNTVVSFVNKMGGQAIRFIGTVLFANIAGASPLGVYYTFLSLYNWGSRVSIGGMGQTIMKRVSEGDNSKYDSSEILSAALTIRFLALGTLFVPIVFFRDQVDQFIGFSNAWWLLYFVLFLSIVYESLKAKLKGDKRIALVDSLQNAEVIVATLSQLLLIYVGYLSFGLIVGFVLGIIFGLTLAVYYINIGIVLPSRSSLNNVFDFTKFSYIDDLFMWENQWLDILAISYFLTSGVAGIYGAAYMIARMGVLLSTSVSISIFPEVSSISASEPGTDIWKEHLKSALKYSSFLTIPLVFGSLAIGDLVLKRVYNFSEGGNVLIILALGVVFLGVYQQIHQVLYGLDNPKHAMGCSFISSIIKLVSLVVLVPVFGMVGAAYSASISMIVAAIIGFAIMYREYDLWIVDLPLTGWRNQIISGILTGVLAEAVQRNINASLLTTLIVSIALGAIGYFIAILIFDKEIQEFLLINYRNRVH